MLISNTLFKKPPLHIYPSSPGLVSRVFPVDKLLEETIKLAEKIGTHSPLIVKMAKAAVNQAYETTLKSGLLFEKSYFYGTFATVSIVLYDYEP